MCHFHNNVNWARRIKNNKYSEETWWKPSSGWSWRQSETRRPRSGAGTQRITIYYYYYCCCHNVRLSRWRRRAVRVHGEKHKMKTSRVPTLGGLRAEAAATRLFSSLHGRRHTNVWWVGSRRIATGWKKIRLATHAEMSRTRGKPTDARRATVATVCEPRGQQVGAS